MNSDRALKAAEHHKKMRDEYLEDHELAILEGRDDLAKDYRSSADRQHEDYIWWMRKAKSEIQWEQR